MLKVSTKYVLSTFHMVYGGDQGWHPRGSAHADPRPRFYAFFRDFQNWPYADPRADARIRVVRAVRVIRARIRADVFGHDYQFTLDIF